MDRDVRLKHFASSLFSSLYKEYNSSFNLPVKLPLLPVESEEGCSDEEKRAVMKACLKYRDVFSGVFVTAFPQIQRSVKHFMTFLTSRCLKLCVDVELFQSFIIICAFIAELNLFCCLNGCYAFLTTAPRCLGAIFNRRLRREFYARGGWEHLRLFCENSLQVNGHSSEHINGDGVPSQTTVQKVHDLLEQNSSSEEDTSSTESSSGEEMVEDDESEESIGEHASEEDSEESECSESSESEDSELEEDSETESSEEDEEEDMAVPKPVNATRTIESDEEETETSEESDPSSMTEDDASESDSEEDESQLDPTLNPSLTNSITPIMQENLSIEKKLL